MNEFDSKYNILDETTPSNTWLTAHYKKSFAYYTIRERLPVILTQIVDQLSRDKESIAIEYGGKELSTQERVHEQIKEIQGGISKLKYELQTDKPLLVLDDNVPDKDKWNEFLGQLDQSSCSYFTGTWLAVECYMYRRLNSIFAQTSLLSNFDYFRKQKQNALTISYETMTLVLEHTAILQSSLKSNDDLEDLIVKLIKLDLWGNRCDLSISAGREIKQSGNPFDLLVSLDECILVNRCTQIWNCIQSFNNKSIKIIDFIQDNSGYELFTDFLLASTLIENGLATKIRFHIKQIPWFISDVMPYDFHWTINTLANNNENVLLSTFGKKLLKYLTDGQMEICPDEYFWTGPYPFWDMKTINCNLYNKLSEANLLIFKGDLNYRKLLGDFNWPFDADFKIVLKEFLPSNLCALRTVKADLICEVAKSVTDKLTEKDPMWMETGKYGLIQFAGLEN